jgi:hypothetical protein
MSTAPIAFTVQNRNALAGLDRCSGGSREDDLRLFVFHHFHLLSTLGYRVANADLNGEAGFLPLRAVEGLRINPLGRLGNVDLPGLAALDGFADLLGSFSFLLLAEAEQQFFLTGRAGYAVPISVAIEKTCVTLPPVTRAIAGHLKKGLLD